MTKTKPKSKKPRNKRERLESAKVSGGELRVVFRRGDGTRVSRWLTAKRFIESTNPESKKPRSKKKPLRDECWVLVINGRMEELFWSKGSAARRMRKLHDDFPMTYPSRSMRVIRASLSEIKKK